jgi:S1-C subfamily serine protease
VLQLVADVTDNLRQSEGRPQFVRVEPPRGAGAPVAGASGYGPYFGSIPDFGEAVTGVRFSDITPNSPAAAAGLKAGDIMIEFDGKPIQNLYDFTYALQSKSPGDVVRVKALREGKPLEVTVTLRRR